MTKSRNILARRRHWTEVELVLVRDHYADTPTRVLAQALGRDEGSVHQKARELGQRKAPELLSEMARQAIARPDHPGRKTQFQKGLVPANKGKRMPPGWAPGDMAKTQFAKGNRPHTWVPIGSYRIKDDCLERKVNDLPGISSVRWHPVHRLVWEAAHGPVPAGHLVVFKPGRRSVVEAEITLDAVELVSRAENLRRNSIHSLPKELVDVMPPATPAPAGTPALEHSPPTRLF